MADTRWQDPRHLLRQQCEQLYQLYPLEITWYDLWKCHTGFQLSDYASKTFFGLIIGTSQSIWRCSQGENKHRNHWGILWSSVAASVLTVQRLKKLFYIYCSEGYHVKLGFTVNTDTVWIVTELWFTMHIGLKKEFWVWKLSKASQPLRDWSKTFFFFFP